MAFWSDYTKKGLEPKRKFTFHLYVGNNETVEHYLITKVNKPDFEVSETAHNYLNHTFKFPGKVKWGDVSFSVVDVISPNTTNRFLKLMDNAGYKIPVITTSIGSTSQTVSKSKSVEALGEVRITQIDADGEKVEEWVLHGAWIKSLKFGELSYDAEEIMTIDVSLAIDYATCEFSAGTAGGPPEIRPKKNN